jgi:hypothetical protein
MALEIQVLALDRHKWGTVKPVNGIQPFFLLKLDLKKQYRYEQTIKYLHRFAFTQKDHIPSQR